MPSGESLHATTKDQVAFIDLKSAPALALDSAMKWRRAVAAHLNLPRVIFASDAGCICNENGVESPLPAGSVTPDSSWTTEGEFYTPEGLQDLTDRENRNSLNLLVAQIRSSMGVVPFVGAGLSQAFGFPSWPKFLTDAAAFHSSPETVLAQIDANKLIDAATLLYEEDPDRFQRLVANAFGGPVSEEQVRTGAVSVLPLLGTGPVITTNFDRVLEAAFLAAERPFAGIVTGQEPDNVIRAMHRNEHVLIKLHGDASDRSARVFTGIEYDNRYGKDGSTDAPEQGIPKLARILFTNRPLLFLGSSLDKDRTLDVLRAVHVELPGVTHYAVLAASFSVKKTRERRVELGKYGISPVWFVPDDFPRIQQILQELLQEASTRTIWKSSKPEVLAAPASPPQPTKISAGLPAYPGGVAHLTSIIRRLARRIVSGRLVFFLGAAAHLNRNISARDLYSSLAKDYDVNDHESRRAEVAQYIIDAEGKKEAWALAKSKLQADSEPPSVVCRFLGELPALLRAAGKPDAANLCFLTTNYDTVMERVMANRGERFHLLYYQVDGSEEGRFVHRDLDGTIRVIERPENIRSFAGPAHIIVKLDGGVPYDPHIPETVAISPMDFSISAGRLPSALPAAVRNLVLDRSLLILGSSLEDAHVQRLVRWSAGNRRVMKTWAVKLDVSRTSALYWSAAGVKLVDCDLADFIEVLRIEVCDLLAKESQPAPPRSASTTG